MNLDDIGVKEGGVIATALAGLSLMWRAALKARSDLRTDGAASDQKAVYKDIIAELQEQVKRLEARAAALEVRVQELSTRVTDEINRRYVAEFQLRRTEGELNEAKAELSDLKAGR